MCAGACHSGHLLKVPASWNRCGCWSPVQTVEYEANSDLSQADHSYHMEHVCTDLPWLQPRNACLIPQHLHILSCIFKKLHLNQITRNRSRITVMIHGRSGLLNKTIMTYNPQCCTNSVMSGSTSIRWWLCWFVFFCLGIWCQVNTYPWEVKSSAPGKQVHLV